MHHKEIKEMEKIEQELLSRSLEINKENRNELFKMIKTVKESLKKDLNNLKEHHKKTQASEEDCKEDILAISNEYNWHLDEIKNKIKVLDKVIKEQSTQPCQMLPEEKRNQ